MASPQAGRYVPSRGAPALPTPSRRRRRLARRLQRVRAELIFSGRALAAIARPVGLLALVLLTGTLLFRRYGHGEAGEPLSWSMAVFSSYGLLLSEHLDPNPGRHAVIQVIQYLWPVLGVLLLAEGIVKLGITVFRKEENKEAWVEILASASRGHIILCGVGSVGFRVLEELVRLDEQVFAVESDADSPFIERARDLGASVLVGDARTDHVLRALNPEHARAIIIATNDDLANLEIAMDVRKIRADIPVILRLFDQALAHKVKDVLGVDVSVSTSMLAAPLFASAALDRTVVGTHRVGDALMVVSEQTVRKGSALDGITVGALLGQHRLTVLGRRSPGQDWTLQPPVDARLQAGDVVQLAVHSMEVDKVHGLNRARGSG